MFSRKKLSTALLFLAIAVTASVAQTPASGVAWATTDPLPESVTCQTANSLLDGRVLVAGGANNRTFDVRRAQLFDPATGTWSVTGSMRRVRAYHTATRLLESRARGRRGRCLSSSCFRGNL